MRNLRSPAGSLVDVIEQILSSVSVSASNVRFVFLSTIEGAVEHRYVGKSSS
jgi:hypothetical protein